MSTRERKRMTLMTRVTEGLLKLREAAEMMRVSYRQAKRIRRRYLREGDAGLVNRSRSRSSNRTRPEGERKRALALYATGRGRRPRNWRPEVESRRLGTLQGSHATCSALRNSAAWRRGRESNPRCPFGAHTISSRTPSATRSPLRAFVKNVMYRTHSTCHMISIAWPQVRVAHVAAAGSLPGLAPAGAVAFAPAIPRAAPDARKRPLGHLSSNKCRM